MRQRLSDTLAMATTAADAQALESWWRADTIRDIQRTIALARARSTPISTLIARVRRLWEDPEAWEVVLALTEKELSPPDGERLADAIVSLAEAADGLPSRDKARIDRQLTRLLRVLPTEDAARVAQPMLDHPRKARRTVAYETLRRTSISPDAVHLFVERFERTVDERLLELVARTPAVAPIVGGRTLLAGLTDPYWRARVIEVLLEHDAPAALDLAEEFAFEFAWAVGRAESTDHLPTLKRLSAERDDDIEFMSIYAWALGRLGASRELDTVEESLDQLTSTDAGAASSA